ncbi:PAS domain S-box protein [Lacibacter sp. H375]|uniref:PAS domain S-box protein n=1 Tax=Lacibacter sp. H375 TaxID=3133424 RepID=UPI0030C60A6B
MNSIALIPESFELSQQLYYVLVKPDGYYAGGNPHFFSRFGLNEKRITTTHSYETVHPDDHTVYTAAIKSVLQEPGVTVSVNLRTAIANEGYISTKWEFNCIEANNSEEYYIQCIGFDVEQSVLDITSERSTTHKEEMLEQLLSNGIDVFFLTDVNNNVSYCSPNVKKVLGYESAELIGKNGFSFVHPDDLDLAIHTFKQELEYPDQNRAVDIRFRKKDGDWLWAEAKGRSLFHNPHIRSMLINLNDISLRKQWEEALKESEKRYKSFFDHLPLPLFVISNDHKTILDVNQFAIERYGYSKEEFLALSLCKIFEKQVKCEHLYDLYKSSQPVEHRTKSGEVMLVTIGRHEIVHSNLNGYLLQINDVTDSYRTNRENELGFDISEILIQPNPLNENLKLALNKLRLFTGWELAEIWVPGFDAVYLHNQVSDFDVSDKEIAAFAETTKNHVYLLSDYVASDVSISKKPFWIEDISASEFEFKRKDTAIRFGFQTALAVPVVSENTIVCCLFFLNRQQKKMNRNEINLISIQSKLFGAEIAKRKNNLMLDQFFLISRDILTIAGVDGRYKRVNPAFEAFSGYTAEEATEIHPLSYVHDYDKPAVLEKLHELSRGVVIPYFENRIVTKTGETKWVAWTATPLLNEGIIIASHRDVTAQKEAAEALKISNERYEFIKNAANEAIWDYDLLSKSIVRSNSYKLLFGYDTDNEHSNLHFWESKLHPEDAARVMHELHAFLSQTIVRQWHCEYRFQKSDGTYAFVSDKGYLITDKDQLPIRLVGTMQDVTEQKEFAEKLKISNERYELVTKATNEAIWDLDLEQNNMTWSEGYRILFGHGFEDADQGLDFWETNIHYDERIRVIDSFNLFLQQHTTPHWECEYRFRRKDGSYANVLDKGYMIFNNKGKPVRIVGAMRDITERKKLEKELMLKERSRQFQIAQAAVFAQEKERAEIGKELHDNIGQLLTTTKLYLEMMKLKQADPIELIDRGTKHINTIITEVRNLSRSLVPSSINDLGLIASVNDLIESFRALGSFDIRFFASNSIEEWMDDTIKLTIYRILQEQLNNIVRHADAKNVMVEMFQEDNKVYLFIADDGIGFNLQTVKKGQGLMNIKSRAELQEGSVEILTNPGQGCKLVIQIPINILKTT